MAQGAPDPSEMTIECISVGEAFDGYLVNGRALPPGKGYLVRNMDRIYGAPETIEAILDTVREVRKKFPETADLYIGDLSWPKGGNMREHRSHQSGRDADIGFYQNDNQQLYTFIPANTHNLDVAKTWYLIQAFLADDKVEVIFLDYQLQAIFHRYAKGQLDYDKEELERIFQYPRGTEANAGIIRWSKGHRDHMHVRFKAEKSVQNAQNFTPSELREMWRLQPAHGFVGMVKDEEADSVEEGIHVVAEGECLWNISSRYDVAINELMKINKLDKQSQLHAGDVIRYSNTKGSGYKIVSGPALHRFGIVPISQLNHTVKDGQSIESIARSYGVSCEQLRAWNYISPDQSLEERRNLLLYVSSGRQPEVGTLGMVTSAEGMISDAAFYEDDQIQLDLPLSSFGSFVTPVFEADK